MSGEHAPPPIDPIIAGQKIRQLTLTAKIKIDGIQSTSSGGSNVGATAWADGQAYEGNSIERLNQLKTVINTRRVVDIRAALHRFESSLDREREYKKLGYRRAVQSIESGNGKQNQVAMKSLRQYIIEINDLAQSLPTFKDPPTTNLENMLRAIMAILRTGGFPGAHNLMWEEVIKNAEEASSNNAETSSAGAGHTDAVGTAVAGTISSGTVVVSEPGAVVF